MSKKTRRKQREAERGLYAPRPVAGTTAARCDQLPAGNPEAQGIFRSELYRALLALIEEALGHPEAVAVEGEPIDLEAELIALGLTERQAQVLVLRYENHQTLAAIGDILGIAAETVREHQRRAEERLREMAGLDTETRVLVSEGQM